MRNAHGQHITTYVDIESLYSGMVRIEAGLSHMTELWVLPWDRNRIRHTDGALDLIASGGIRIACRHNDADAFWMICS